MTELADEKSSNARLVAMAVLNRFNPAHSDAAAILNKFLPKTAEKQRATDLLFGSIRNLAAIDLVITELSRCRIERIPAKILNIIRIGVYELIYCPATSQYAIVNEAVENAKKIAGKKEFGFVNAVLREITRHITNRQAAICETNIKKALPQTSLAGCEFDRDLLPQPQSLPADYLSTVFSLPKWLVTGWLDEFGLEKTRRICAASNRKPAIYVRFNSLKTSLEKISQKFRDANIDFEVIAEDAMIRIKSPQAIIELPGFAEGLFCVQDITSSRAAKALQPQPAWKILDLCAAPGTKTSQLAELTFDKAEIFATDIDRRRLEKVKENIARLGLTCIHVVDYENIEKIPPVDAVLLDAPCSNTGVLAKRIEVRFRITPQAIAELAKTQMHLLESAAKLLTPRGKICYSTCSIQKAENSAIVKEFLTGNLNFNLEFEQLTLPSPPPADCDGGYVAIIAKKQLPSRNER